MPLQSIYLKTFILVFNEKDEVTDLLTKLKNIAYKEDENSKKNEVGKQ